MAPTKEEFEAAYSALEDDAAVWSDTADDLDSATTAAEGLDLTEGEFSWAGDLAGLPELYRELKEKLSTLLGEGRDASNTVSEQLIEAKTTYEEEDEAGVHKMNGVW